MWLILSVILILIAISLFLYKLNDNYYVLALCPRIKTVDGSPLEDKVVIIPGVSIFGNNFDIAKLNPVSIFQFCRRCNLYSKGKSYLFHFYKSPVYNINNAEDAEEVFQNTSTLVTKSVLYELVRPFLGEGLLISTDEKWHRRRKLLTPAFYFNVLQSFNEIFKEESLKLLTKLHTFQSDKVDVIEVISAFTLNNVCETALGVKLDNIKGSTEYRKVIDSIESVIVERLCNVIMVNEWIFKLFGPYEKNRKYIKIAHDFSSQIIMAKREEYRARRQQMEMRDNADKENDKNDINLRKRYAMLDTLLDEEFMGHIDHQGICDEVNTFMFEGYDTTSTCLIFTILNLALHPEIQLLCREELKNLGDFSSLSVFELNKLDYLECVLKETLRLYPPVPFLARRCSEETKVNGLILPQGAEINIHIFDIMRDPKHFPEPNLFKPERFLLENCMHRHPFAFVPFSAGSRNCIGQKFAILEMKAVMVAILQNFQILPITKLEDLIFKNGIILRTQQRIYVKLRKLHD